LLETPNARAESFARSSKSDAFGQPAESPSVLALWLMGRVFGGEHQPCGPQASVKRRQKLRSVFRWRLTFNRLNVCYHRLFVSHRPQGDVALFGRLNQACRDRVNGVAELSKIAR